ncbi:scavenger receptor class F member 2-like [Physeter macrocephalus]|uniref:Scavenger receptor class F member 2-like n=1 Tax=Physeter macrocephalus TaxID=9755 RepID=A0A9W2WE09_PHYMC|nr:scavenger receptor class F member 2-like [Physeter catodon]
MCRRTSLAPPPKRTPPPPPPAIRTPSTTFLSGLWGSPPAESSQEGSPDAARTARPLRRLRPPPGPPGAREARVQRLENERCREGGPELQRPSRCCSRERREAAAAVSGVARGRRMPPKMEKFLQIAPHSLAIVLGPAEGPAGERSEAARPASPAQPRQLARHHIGYEIFADFKAENMQHFWNKKVTAAVAETFFLGWIDEQVLLIQGKEEHLEALREGWSRRALRPPSGFHIRCLVHVSSGHFVSLKEGRDTRRTEESRILNKRENRVGEESPKDLHFERLSP